MKDSAKVMAAAAKMHTALVEALGGKKRIGTSEWITYVFPDGSKIWLGANGTIAEREPDGAVSVPL